MPATGDFVRARALQEYFTNLSRDGRGATLAAMAATQQATANAFRHERDPADVAWAPLAPSTLKRRKPGPILRGLQRDLLWALISIGVWYVRSKEKRYAVYHLGPDKRTGRPARPYLPVEPDQMRAVSERVHAALGSWLNDHRVRAGL